MTSITFNPRQPRETVPKKDIALFPPSSVCVKPPFFCITCCYLVTQISINRILTYWNRKKTMGRNVLYTVQYI